LDHKIIEEIEKRKVGVTVLDTQGLLRFSERPVSEEFAEV
jgi:hypothetical protein